jgi:hypothetical protein
MRRDHDHGVKDEATCVLRSQQLFLAFSAVNLALRKITDGTPVPDKRIGKVDEPFAATRLFDEQSQLHDRPGS